jgi:hypothetical protein
MATALSMMARIWRPSQTFPATRPPCREQPAGARDDWDAQNSAPARRQHFTESKLLREKEA